MNNIDGHRYFTLRHAENTLFNCMHLWSWPLYKWNCSRWFVFILVKAQIWFPPVPKQTDVGSDLFLVETKLKMFSAEHKPRHREACSSASTTFMYFTHAVRRRCGWQSMGPGFSVIRADERWGRFPALVMAAGVRVDLAASGLRGVVSEEHEVPLRWAICFIKRPFSQSIQLSSGEPSAVLPALYRLSHWADATCGTG